MAPLPPTYMHLNTPHDLIGHITLALNQQTHSALALRSRAKEKMPNQEGDLSDEDYTQAPYVDDDIYRAIIKKGSTSKYHVGDRVWFDPGGSKPWEGPYLIASVPSNGRYTLCHDDDGNNEAVNGGEEVDESQLKRA
ncbi:hypothetical protein B0O99DRAFT_692714 [Bisporella sp. PMI_857]|nr:hypothetical protein B0O99DRAFT_692714 [Bisporella sp. PMI_857]